MLLESNGFSHTIPVTTAVQVLVDTGRPARSLPYPLTIRAVPGSGGTLLVEYRVSADGNWIAWPASTVSTATVYVVSGPVNALRLTATTASGTVEIAQ